MNRFCLSFLLIAGMACAQEPAPPVNLHQNVRDMRVMVENDAAQAANEARGSTVGMFYGGETPQGTASIGQMRRDMLDTFEYLEKKMPCLGAKVDVKGGQAILICGENTGVAGNNNYGQNAPVTYQVPPPQPAVPEPPAATPAEEISP